MDTYTNVTGSIGFNDGFFNVAPARVESKYPNVFRAAKYPNGAVRIQGAYAWTQGNEGGVVWKDLPLVNVDEDGQEIV
jgi:hypothetical protein